MGQTNIEWVKRLMDNLIDLGLWEVTYNPKPIPIRHYDYDFCHDEYDGENGLCGNASSVLDAINQIIEIEL